MTRRYLHACHHLRLKVVAYRRQMELDPEQLLAQVVEDGGNRRLGEDVGDLASRADVVHFDGLGGDSLA